MATVTVNEETGEAVITVTLITTKQMLDAGGVEIFAKSQGWIEKVEVEGELVDNPDTALEYGERKIREWVTEVTKKNFIAQSAKQYEDLFESIR
jgi:hypothetical protein